MARRAAHPVARKRTVLEILISGLRIVHEVQTEVRLRVLWIRRSRIVVAVGVKLALSHHSMASKAEISNGLLIFLSVFEVSQFAVELRIEDRIAAGQTHWRPTPFTIRRDVDRVR